MTTDFDAALRSMDAARPLTTDQQRTAAAVLDRIVTADHDPHVRRPKRRMLLIATAAAVAIAGGVFAVLPGSGGGRAYASWTPAPTPLTEAEIDVIAPACRARMRPGLLTEAPVVLAERRGDYAMLLIRRDNPETTGSCLVHNIPGSDDVDDIRTGGSGSSGPARTAEGSEFTQGGIADYLDASVTDGAVGPDVAGVTIHAGSITAHATVKDGRYVVWWPGPAFVRGADAAQPRLNLAYDIVLRNGTIIAGAQPSRR